MGGDSVSSGRQGAEASRSSWSLEGVGWSVKKRARLAYGILGDSMTSPFAAGITGVGGAVPQRGDHPDRA